MSLTDEEVRDVQHVIANTVLRNIEFFEVSARRNDPPPDQPAEGRLTIEVQQRIDEQSFGVRLNARAVLPTGEASASVAGTYDLLNGVAPSIRTLRLFANEVAVMTVFPYLREAVATATSKVFGDAVYLPLVQRGEIALDIEDEGTRR